MSKDFANLAERLHILMEAAPLTEVYKEYRKKHFFKPWQTKLDKIGFWFFIVLGVIGWGYFIYSYG